MWIRWLVCIALWGMLILPGCSEPLDLVDEPPLRVGWFCWPGWYPLVIAKEKGLFAKHGVNVEPVLYETYADCFPEFAAGKVDAIFSGMYELLKSNISGMKIVLITDYSEGAEGLVVASDIVTPMDLKGKRIGIQGGLSGSEFVIMTQFQRLGLSRNDVTFVDVAPELVFDTMPERIQAGYTWEPYLSAAKSKGYHTLFTTAALPGMVPDVVAFQKTVVANRKKEVQAFVDAWFEALQYWADHREEGNAIIAQEIGIPPESISIEGCRSLFLAENKSAFDEQSVHSVYKVGEKQIDFFVSRGYASSVPLLDAVLDAEFIIGLQDAS